MDGTWILTIVTILLPLAYHYDTIKIVYGTIMATILEKYYHVLIADDEKGIRDLLKDLLEDSFYVNTIDRGDLIIDELKRKKYDILILDLQMPGKNGIEVLQAIHNLKIDIVVVVITASNDVQLAITSMKLGAYDYLVKPFDTDKLLVILKNIVEKLDLENEVNELREKVGESFRFKNIIGKSPKMQRIFATLERVIDTDSTILIIGESGTGKEIVAKAIHYNSNRKQYPFKSIDCSTIPQDLIGSELFGHEKGAFTGAIARKIGKFEIASKGTLFLDEISNLSFDMQAKLLRVLQEKEFERIGGNEIIKVETRIVAASNRDIREMVKQGTFREDLYYRLNVMPIYLPPLKERKEDIPLFIDYFLKRFTNEYGRTITLDLQSRLYLTDYHWPGNVRQLENVIKRLVLLSTEDVVKLDIVKSVLEFEEYNKPAVQQDVYAAIPSTIATAPVHESFDNGDTISDNDTTLQDETVKTLDEVEKEYIEKMLKQFNFNISVTAKAINVSRKTMHNKLKKYNIAIKKTVADD